MHSLTTRQIIDATVIGSSALVPEIKLRLAPAGQSFEAFRNNPALAGVPTPFWGKTWPGGQALARYILDHREAVRGCHVFDLGAGCAIAAIAAGLAGAASVTSLDRDPNALRAAASNAELNGVVLGVKCGEIESLDVAAGDVLLAGDLWYEQFEARRVTASLRRMAARAAIVLCGDCRRSHFPKAGLIQLATYEHSEADTGEGLVRSSWGVWSLGATQLA